jgi:hypothetical protein
MSVAWNWLEIGSGENYCAAQPIRLTCTVSELYQPASQARDSFGIFPRRAACEPVVQKLSVQVKKAFDLIVRWTYNPASLTGKGFCPRWEALQNAA